MQNKKFDVDQAQRTSAIVWFILLLSQVMFLGLIFSFDPSLRSLGLGTAPILDQNAPVVIAAALLAAINLIVSIIINKRCIDHAIATQQPSYVQTGLVIGCAFCESISLIGLVLALGFGYPYFYFWFIVGIIGIFLHFPRRATLVAASANRPK